MKIAWPAMLMYGSRSVAAPPDLTGPLEGRNPGGLGIHLIRNMADRIEYRREDGQNRLRIETARR